VSTTGVIVAGNIRSNDLLRNRTRDPWPCITVHRSNALLRGLNWFLLVYCRHALMRMAWDVNTSQLRVVYLVSLPRGAYSPNWLCRGTSATTLSSVCIPCNCDGWGDSRRAPITRPHERGAAVAVGSLVRLPPVLLVAWSHSCHPSHAVGSSCLLTIIGANRNVRNWQTIITIITIIIIIIIIIIIMLGLAVAQLIEARDKSWNLPVLQPLRGMNYQDLFNTFGSNRLCGFSAGKINFFTLNSI
jgi:hypothetical protein